MIKIFKHLMLEKMLYFFWEASEETQNIANLKLDQDTDYDVEIAAQNMHGYIQQLLRDFQPK